MIYIYFLDYCNLILELNYIIYNEMNIKINIVN